MNIQQFTQRKSKELKERANSARNLKGCKQIRNVDYFGSSIKMAENIQSNSKQSKQIIKVEYDFSNHKISSKNLNENEYIKSLYKKYLGKENSTSERKQRVDSKIVKNLFIKQQSREIINQSKPLKEITVNTNITQIQQPLKDKKSKDSSQMFYCNQKYSLSKNKSLMLLSVNKEQKKIQKKTEKLNFYVELMNEQYLDLIGNPRSSLVRCMRNICKAKKIAKESK